MMSIANTAQAPLPQPQSKILDADFDAASVLSQSALLSRHCADRAEHAAIDCYKICRTHADVAQLASTLLITIGTKSLHTKSHWPATATSAPPLAYQTSSSTSSSGSQGDNQQQPFHIRADALIKSLDLAPLLALVQETAKRARTVCAAHIDCSHCQACAQAAAQVQVVVHSLLSKEAAKHATTEETTPTTATGAATKNNGGGGGGGGEKRGANKPGTKGKRAAAQQHHDVHEKREAEMKQEHAQAQTQPGPSQPSTHPAAPHKKQQQQQQQPSAKSPTQAHQDKDQQPQQASTAVAKKAQDESTASTSSLAQTAGPTSAPKRNPRRKPRGGAAAKYTESFKGGQHEQTAQAMVAAESTLAVAGDRGSGESQPAEDTATTKSAAAAQEGTPRVRRQSMHDEFPLGTAEGQKYDTDHEMQSWEQMQEQGLGGGLELGSAEGQKISVASGLHHETGAPGGGGVQLGSIDQEARDQAQAQAQAGRGKVGVEVATADERQRVKVKEE